MDRLEFLNRVRTAAAAGRAFRVHIPSDRISPPNETSADEDLAARMMAEVNAVGGHGVVVDTPVDARRALDALLRHYVPHSALCWRHPVLDCLGLAELLAERSIELIDHAHLAPLDLPQQRQCALAADIGITSATLAVADTGTLVMVAEPGRERIASLLPPVHVAVITAEQIRADLFAACGELESAGLDRLSSNVTFITGPSKTGDLELRLTAGVHGPGHWHVIVIRQSGR